MQAKPIAANVTSARRATASQPLAARAARQRQPGDGAKHQCRQNAVSSGSHLRDASALERAAQREAWQIARDQRLERREAAAAARAAAPPPRGAPHHKLPCTLTSPSGRQRGRRSLAAAAGPVAPRGSGAPQAPPCPLAAARSVLKLVRCKAGRGKHRAARLPAARSGGSAAGPPAALERTGDVREVPGMLVSRFGSCGISRALPPPPLPLMPGGAATPCALLI